MGHVTFGMKVIDVRGIDQKPNDSLLNFQSRDLSFIFKFHLMKDTKECYTHFKDFFDLVEHIEKDGLPFCSH